MGLEIERKFLVRKDIWQKPEGGVRFRQGYVDTKNGTTVRVRVAGSRAYVTFKDHAVGLTRHEFEYEIPVADAETILESMRSTPSSARARCSRPQKGSASPHGQ